MTSLGITGHQMREGIDWQWVRAEIRRVLSRFGGNDILWTCLANGADTIAAEEALASGMIMKAVIPHAEYAQVFGGNDRLVFDELIGKATEVIQIAPVHDLEQAYLNAGLRVADMSDLLLVVWDGKPAAGKGGTGDVAAYAKSQGSSVIWLDTDRSKVRDISEARL